MLTQKQKPTQEEQFHKNFAEMEGLITRIWTHRDHVLARLAIYDAHTEILDPTGGRNGLPKRKAHYVTILFEDGKVGQNPVSLKRKDRIRVTGYLRDEPYSENLRRFLLKAQKVDLLAELSDSDRLAEIRVSRVATYLIVQSLILYTKR